MTNQSSASQAKFLLRYSLQVFGAVVLVAIILRIFLFSSFVMSGTNMVPTIWTGDFLIGTKWRLSQVDRGEVVAIRCPEAKDRLCLKRVIGVPGDRVEHRLGRLMLNGESADYTIAGAFATEFIGESSRRIWPDRTGHSDFEAQVVPPDMLFLLNDKRSDHEDSRTWGAVPKSDVVARVRWIWMSLEWTEGEQIRSWPQVRWSRLFYAIN